MEKTENPPLLKWFISAILISNTIGFIGMYAFVYFKFEKRQNSQIETNTNIPCGSGTEKCITKIRNKFSTTGKTILGEEYLGNGNFGISFIDRNRHGSYTARVSTDCNCGITNVQVSNLR
jgi:hypothetical protein